MPPTVFNSDEKVTDALRIYADSRSIVSAAATLGVGVSTLGRLLRKHGAMRMRGPRHKIAFNEDYFATIDTEAKAYWLGFIYADGNVRKNKTGAWSFSLNLADVDHGHVVALASELGLPQAAVKRRKRPTPQPSKPHHRIQRTVVGSDISSLVVVRKRLVMDLIRHGVHPNKTALGMSLPSSVPDDLKRHFVRGVFDGDGSWYLVHRKGKRVSFAGSLASKTRPILDEIDAFLWKEGAIRSPGPYFTKSLAIWRLTFDGTRVAGRLFDFLYQDATIFLDRKMALGISRPLPLSCNEMRAVRRAGQAGRTVTEHGTLAMSRRCKCDACRVAASVYRKAHRTAIHPRGVKP